MWGCHENVFVKSSETSFDMIKLVLGHRAIKIWRLMLSYQIMWELILKLFSLALSCQKNAWGLITAEMLFFSLVMTFGGWILSQGHVNFSSQLMLLNEVIYQVFFTLTSSYVFCVGESTIYVAIILLAVTIFIFGRWGDVEIIPVSDCFVRPFKECRLFSDNGHILIGKNVDIDPLSIFDFYLVLGNHIQCW